MAIDVDAVYAGKSMNAAYVKDSLRGDATLRIAHVAVQEFGDDDEPKKKKVVLSFDREPKELALNVTNKNIISEAWGKDAEKWIGRDLRIRTGRTNFGGKMVDCVLVECPNHSADMPPATASPNLTQKAMAWQQIKQKFGGDAGKAAPVFKAAFDAVAKGRAETQLTEQDWASVALWDPAANVDAELPPF